MPDVLVGGNGAAASDEWRGNEKRWRARTKSRAEARPRAGQAPPLQFRAESQQTAIAILHHELPRGPAYTGPARDVSAWRASGAKDFSCYVTQP